MTEYLDFLVNWAESVTAVYDFKTSFPQVSRSGREQRIALRQTARRTLQYHTVATKDAFRRFERRMAKAQAQVLLVYDPIRYVTLLGPGSTFAPMGLSLVFSKPATGLLVTESPVWMRTGAVVALIHRERIAFRVLAVGGGTLTLVDDDGSSWPVGTRIHQTLPVNLEQDVSATRKTNGTLDVSLSCAVIPASEFGTDYDTAPLVYNGREVFLLKPNWSTEPTSNFLWPSEIVDFGRGVIQTVSPIQFSTRLFTQTHTFPSTAAADAMVNFFGRMRGQQGEFYAPTWEDNLPIASTSLHGTNALTVVGTEAAETYTGDTVYQALAIFFRDGRTPLFRQVTAASASGANSLIVCDKTWPYDIKPADVLMTSWLLVCRHASDTLTLTWMTTGAAQAQLTFKTLEALPPE